MLHELLFEDDLAYNQATAQAVTDGFDAYDVTYTDQETTARIKVLEAEDYRFRFRAFQRGLWQAVLEADVYRAAAEYRDLVSDGMDERDALRAAEDGLSGDDCDAYNATMDSAELVRDAEIELYEADMKWIERCEAAAEDDAVSHEEWEVMQQERKTALNEGVRRIKAMIAELE